MYILGTSEFIVWSLSEVKETKPTLPDSDLDAISIRGIFLNWTSDYSNLFG